MHNFHFAWRYLLKRRGNNLTRVVSLTLGLSVGLVIFAYINDVLTFDRFFPDVERICQIWDIGDEGDVSSSMIAPLGPALAEEMPAVEAATRLKGTFSYELWRGESSFDVHFLCVDTMFFDVLDFGLTKGDIRHFTGLDKIMLSETFARTLFGDRDPMGEVVLLKNETPLTVAGIFRDPPRNNHLGRFNALVPFDYLENAGYYTGWDGGDSFATYLKLRPGKSPADVESLLPDFYERHGMTRYIDDFGSVYVLLPVTRSSKAGSGVVQTSYILLTLALLILFVTTMNYVLISISTLVSRAKTIAMLRCNGASRADVGRIFLWETLLLVAAALLAALFLIWALQGPIERLTATPLGELFAGRRIWVPAAVVLLTFILAGFLPAQVFASVPLNRAFRGAADNRRRWKQVLLAVEIVSVTFTLVLLTAFSLQLNHLRDGGFGFDPDRVVSVSPTGTRAQWRNMAEAFASMPEVEAAGATSLLPVWGYGGQPCYDESTRELLFGCRIVWIDENYIPAIGMRMAAGKNFTFQSRPNEAIVNETYCRLRGWTPEEALGRRVCNSSEQDPADFHTVIGVVRDFRTRIETGETEPIVLHPFSESMPDPERLYGGSNLCIRLREATPEAVEAVRKKAEEFRSADNHRILVLDDLIGESLRLETRIRSMVLMVSAVVLLIALLGLSGYLGDEVRRRSKEIAIRKVNGADAKSIVCLLARDAALLAVPAVGAGALTGYATVTQIMQLFADRARIGWGLYTGAAAAVLLLVGVLLLVRSWRAARENPIGRIKAE